MLDVVPALLNLLVQLDVGYYISFHEALESP